MPLLISIYFHLYDKPESVLWTMLFTINAKCVSSLICGRASVFLTYLVERTSPLKQHLEHVTMTLFTESNTYEILLDNKGYLHLASH